MKADPHYNALQVKYAYAVTCHKAQGGQWQNVFLDQGYMSDEYLTPDYFRWLYTAFTRASKTLYLVNYPKEQIEDRSIHKNREPISGSLFLLCNLIYCQCMNINLVV